MADQFTRYSHGLEVEYSADNASDGHCYCNPHRHVEYIAQAEEEEAQEWKQEIAEKFPEYEIVEGPLSLSVACHIGPGAMAVTCMKKVR